MASPRTRRVLQELKPHNENDVSNKIGKINYSLSITIYVSIE